jgi:predicted nucleic acid-binding protein
VILVDTSAFYAILDVDDRHHAAARATLGALGTVDEPLLTHEYVVVETTALVQRRLGVGTLRRFVDDVLPLVGIAWVDQALHLEAREALLAAGTRDVSLVDWTSFLVMRRLGVRRAFTFDPDFATEGFEVLPTADRPTHVGRSRSRSRARTSATLGQ